MAELFGFTITRKKDEEGATFTLPTSDDGAEDIAHGGFYSSTVDIEGKDRTQYDLIKRYRSIAQQPECDSAIEDIVNESIVGSEDNQSININLDNVEVPDNVKKTITEEFNNIYGMLNFNELGHDIFRRWYIDGRVYHHLVINESQPKAGIQEIRPIDAAKIRKVKEVKKKKDEATGASLVESVNEFYIYQEKPGGTNQGVKLSNDAVSYVTSGLLDIDRKRIVSHLHKALKPINQLRMMEDSLVIYRLARAPERRIFYIDVGNLPRGKAETYMKDIMARYRNKLVYDADSGKIRDDRKHMSMLEDFWLPRREGGRGTEITTLPGGENLGQIDDILYFQKKMYKALNVPVSRLEQDQAAGLLGRASEINRDELKFQKFIDRLRNNFPSLFLGILKKQLMLKGVITEEDWDNWKNDIVVDYVRDNHFSELRDAELLREKLQTLDVMQQYVGEFFSKEYVMKNVLLLDDDAMKEMKDQIAQEKSSGEIPDDSEEDQDGN